MDYFVVLCVILAGISVYRAIGKDDDVECMYWWWDYK